MTRSKTYILTAVSVLLFIFLGWAFADGLFSLDNLFSGEYYSEYTIITFILLALIVAAGYLQAQRLPEEGVATEDFIVDEGERLGLVHRHQPE